MTTEQGQQPLGIVSVESPIAETILFQLQLSSMGNYLLEALIRFAVLDVVDLREMQSRIKLEHSRPSGLTLVTETAYDALLIAREIALFRQLKPIHVHSSSLAFRFGVHCSETLRDEGFSISHPDIEMAATCADLAKANEIACTASSFESASLDIRADTQILSEFSAFGSQPASNVWKFDERYLSRRQELSHSYFISYSHKDLAVADHLESLLRRSGRTVRRDEGFLNSETQLSDQVSGEIRKCDTFVALYSENYNTSDFCRGELAVARGNKNRCHKPQRIILVLLSNTEVPVDFAGFLRYSGESRVSREKLVLQLVAQEDK